MEILITHPELELQKTRLSADVAAAATSCTVENNAGFDTNDYVVFGTPSEELTEVVLLTSTTGNTTLGHTTGPVFAHSARTGLSKIKYNQAKVYSSTTEDGTYSLVDTVDLTLDHVNTVYDDTSGTSSTWYKIKYYDEKGDALSSYSPAVEGTGYTEESLKSMTDEVLEDFNDPEGKDLPKEQVYRYLRAGVRKLTMLLTKTFPDYRRNYATDTLSSGVASLPTRFLGFIRVDAGVTLDTAYKTEYVSEGSLQAGTTYSSLKPKVFIRGSNVYVEPDDITNIYMWYWDYPTPMTLASYEHGLPYGARDVLVPYALWRVWLSKDVEKASLYRALYNDAVDEYLEFMAHARQNITKDMVELTAGTDIYDFF